MKYFLEASGNILGIFVNLIVIVPYVYLVYTFSLSLIRSSSIYERAGIGLLILALMYLAARYGKEIIKREKINSQIRQLSRSSLVRGSERFYDYEKMVPATEALRTLQGDLENAVRQWANDARISKFDLELTNENLDGKVNCILSVDFYSSAKKMSMHVHVTNLKFDPASLLNEALLYYDPPFREVYPFIGLEFWRDAVILSLNTSEGDTLGKIFHCSVSSSCEKRFSVLISTGRESGVYKYRVYWVEDGKLYDGPPQPSKLLKDYTESGGGS
jgi:hypothetical protein